MVVAPDGLMPREFLDQWGIMSYINDALHKAQKEKESSYALYGDVVSAAGKKPDEGMTRAWVTVLLVILFTVTGLAAWRYWPHDPEMSGDMTLVQSPRVAAAEALAPRFAPRTEEIKKTPAADKTLVTEEKVKKKNAVFSDKMMKQGASPQPASGNAENLFAQALQKQREGNLEEAKELYKKVIRKEPSHFQAMNNLGVVYLKLKTYKWAIVRFNDAIDTKHNYVDAHYNLACLYAQKNDTKRSLFYLKNAVNFNPEVRQWVAQDDDFKNLAGLPEFNKIVQAGDR